MSDGITDCERDSERSHLYDEYLGKLLAYLKEPTDGNYRRLKNASEKVDGVPTGLMAGRTAAANSLEERVKKLREGDRQAWARLLVNVGCDEEFRKISPFKNKMIVLVNYGCGFANADLLGLEEIMDKKIEGKNYRICDCDKYAVAVAIPKKAFKKVEIFWLSCGIMGVKGPRNREGEPKKETPKPPRIRT